MILFHLILTARRSQHSIKPKTDTFPAIFPIFSKNFLANLFDFKYIKTGWDIQVIPQKLTPKSTYKIEKQYNRLF